MQISNIQIINMDYLSKNKTRFLRLMVLTMGILAVAHGSGGVANADGYAATAEADGVVAAAYRSFGASDQALQTTNGNYTGTAIALTTGDIAVYQLEDAAAPGTVVALMRATLVAENTPNAVRVSIDGATPAFHIAAAGDPGSVFETADFRIEFFDSASTTTAALINGGSGTPLTSNYLAAVEDIDGRSDRIERISIAAQYLDAVTVNDPTTLDVSMTDGVVAVAGTVDDPADIVEFMFANRNQFHFQIAADAGSAKFGLDLAQTVAFTNPRSITLDDVVYNLALGKPTAQSSQLGDASSYKAVDGSTSGNFTDNSVTHTYNQPNAWWQVDLEQISLIDRIEIWNRNDCCQGRLKRFYVFVSDVPFDSDNLDQTRNRPGVREYYVSSRASHPTNIAVGGEYGRYVRVQLAGENYLSLAEVRVIEHTNRPPVIGYIPTQQALVGDNILLPLTASDPDGDALDFTIADLPPGMDFDHESNMISGILTTPGSFTSTVTVTDGVNHVERAVYWFISTGMIQSCEASTNIAIQGRAQQSTNYRSRRYLAEEAIDGMADTFSHTLGNDDQAAWTIDFDGDKRIDQIILHNRENCCGNRLRDIEVEVRNSAGKDVYHSGLMNPENQLQSPDHLTINLPQAIIGSRIKVKRIADSDFSGFNPGSNQNDKNVLSLGEVEVQGCELPDIEDAENLALNKPTSQSSTYDNGVASLAVDGNTDGRYSNGSVTHTKSQYHAWWEVDLQQSQPIDRIEIWNRSDCCSGRLSLFYVFVSDEPFVSQDLQATRSQPGVNTFSISNQAGFPSEIDVGGETGRYVRVQLAGHNFLSLAEVKVFHASNDQDGDGIPDDIDPDRDGDGVNNEDDAFPDNPTESGDQDGDGIGDNTDPDRDGDGVSNDAENAAGTDPNDAADYPDHVSPELVVNNPANQTLEDRFVTVTGVARDPAQPYSGMDAVDVISDQYPGTTFPGVVQPTTDNFSIEVPLKLGPNTLTITARDVSGNITETQRTVERVSPPRFRHLLPASGALVATPTIDIVGEIHTYLPVERFSFRINQSQITPIPSGEEGIYRFDSPGVALDPGENIFTLSVVSDDGNDQATLQITHVPEGAENIPAPTITLLSPADGALLNQERFPLAAQIDSAAGPLAVKLNGVTQLAMTEGQTFYHLSAYMMFPAGDNTLSVTIEAEDSLGKVSTLTANFTRDVSPPVVVLDNALEPLPVVNPVDQSTYLLSGTVSDAHLTNFLVNNQSVALRPETGSEVGENTYRFSAVLSIASGETAVLTIAAYDRSGNRFQSEYLLQNTATTSIKTLVPTDQAALIGGDSPITLQVVARANGLTGNESVVTFIDNDPSPVPLTLNGTLASGELMIPGDTAEHTLTTAVLDAGGGAVAEDSLTITVTNPQEIPVELVRIEPENHSNLIEPNAAIELYFNRQIDVDLLDVHVTETLHGKTYLSEDPLGADFINNQGYRLVEVHRDFETVPGVLNRVPGETSVAFSPARLYGFHADLFVTVQYDGEELLRSTFKVRELPTFINGSVADQFGQPLAGIPVTLPALSRSTTTNGDGGFAFGYQETGEQLIPGGSYQMLINPGFADPRMGMQDTTIHLQQNHPNNLPRYILHELDRSISFYPVSSGSINTLAKGDLVMDLTAARALFPAAEGDGTNTTATRRTSGQMHAQFLSFEHLGVQTWPSATPHWAFGLQPKGVEIEGAAALSLQIPALRGSYDYIDPAVYDLCRAIGLRPGGGGASTRSVLAK